MLFVVNYRRRPSTDERGIRKLIQIFLSWTPATSVEVIRHYHFVRGGAGIVILDVANSSALFQALTTFDAIIEYEVEAVLSVHDAIAIKMDVDAWVGSLDSMPATISQATPRSA